MSDDIVARLRELACISGHGELGDAADEIERLRAELAAENETVMRLTAELSGVKACLKSLEKHFARAKGNTQSMKLSRNAARSERDALRELLREARDYLKLADADGLELLASIDTLLNKGDGDD